jgi:hypothetical protein
MSSGHFTGGSKEVKQKFLESRQNNTVGMVTATNRPENGTEPVSSTPPDWNNLSAFS